MLRRALVLAAGLALAACGGDSGPSKIEAEGAWSGSVNENGSTVAQLTLTLVETTGSVTGSGNITANAQAIALTATGSYVEPNLSLTLSAPCCNDINLTATVAATAMSGTLNGSGFVGSSIQLTRQ